MTSEPGPAGQGEELLDVVSATGEFLGTAPRSQVHAEGRWHNVFHCLIVRPAPPVRVVLQRRSRSARSFPGKLDLSATGHLSAGETPPDGVREITEELGIEVSPDDLVPLGVRLLVDDGGEGANRERVHVFLHADDRPLDGFSPAPNEVDGLVEADVDGLLGLLDDEGDQATLTVVEWAPGQAPEPATITLSDMVAPADGYWVVVLTMAKRFAAGESPLAI